VRNAYNMENKSVILYPNLNIVKMKTNIFISDAGSNRSSDNVSANANAVINPLKQKGGFKNLKHPIIYLSGILSYLLVVITFTFTSVGCEKPAPYIGKIPNDTSEVSITDFSINDSTCHWNFANLIRDSIYLINSQEEFITFISCEGDIPSTDSIDFNDQTLLLVYGQTPNMIESKMISLGKTANNYIFNVTIQCNDATAIDKYFIAIIVSEKIIANTIILFNKTIDKSQ
jgi:hypothetical protein